MALPSFYRVVGVVRTDTRHPEPGHRLVFQERRDIPRALLSLDSNHKTLLLLPSTPTRENLGALFKCSNAVGLTVQMLPCHQRLREEGRVRVASRTFDGLRKKHGAIYGFLNLTDSVLSVSKLEYFRFLVFMVLT